MIEGWRFFQLSDERYKAKDYKEAYAIFASRVEDIIQKEIETYLTVFWAKERGQGNESLVTGKTDSTQ